MNPVSPSLLDLLDFKSAAIAEAGAWRNLLPPEPWQAGVAKQPGKFAAYARHRLEAGMPSASSQVVRARKPHQQTRPVPVVGIAERIALRALSDRVLRELPPADRSQEAYESFIAGPMNAAFRGKRVVQINDRALGYVVESDIAAFYEYVDHSRLLKELQLRTGEVEFPRLLVRLLTEIQGRPFGLPQLLDASDELSEVYIRIVERELRRRGLDVWRYNDDFRISASTYEEGQGRVEALADEASAAGLILNEKKTRVLKFSTYFWKNWTQPPTEGDVEFKPELIRISTDYGDLDTGELAKVAADTFARLDSDAADSNHITLKKMSPDDVRDLARAIGIAAKQADKVALEHVTKLFEYAPQLGHRLGTYMVVMAAAGTDIGPVWDALVAKSDVLNAWQRIWLVYVARATQLVTTPARRTWVDSQRHDDDAFLRAEATLAVAPHGLISFDEVDRAVRVEPEALIPWYALSAKSIPKVNPGRLQALMESHGVIEAMFFRPQKINKKTP